MISNQYRFIYLHVSKTGGNSIQTVLLPYSDDRKVLKPWQDGHERFGLEGPVTPKKHAVLSDYEALYPGVSRNYKVMISVRHPFERAISAYFSPHRWVSKKKDPTWDEQAFFAMLKTPEVVPVVDFLRVGGAIATPDLIVRFETLRADFSRAVSELGLPADLVDSLPHVNRATQGGQLRMSLLRDRALRDHVEHIFRDDMDVLGYASFQPPEMDAGA